MNSQPAASPFGTRPLVDVSTLGGATGGPSYALIHLDRLAANLRAVRELVGPHRGIMVPVKADAYGHGAVQVSRYVQEHGLGDLLAVSTVDEAVELRQAGVSMPIFKLSPCLPGEFTRALQAGVTVPIGSMEEGGAAQSAAAALGTRAEVHLMVDSGMRRVGVEARDAADLARHIVEECPNLHVEGMFTHFAVSDTDTPDAIAFTREQLDRFRTALADVQEELGYLVELVHTANSGGVLMHPASWGSLVRPGIMTYGYYPDASTPRTVELAPVLEWRAPLTLVKRVTAGETVSYGRTWTAQTDGWVGTLPVGYADGYRRHLSNRGTILAGGNAHPVAGRVCMDQVMVDLGASTSLRAGDEMILLGRDGAHTYMADEMAADLDTISYEVLTGIGRRVERRWTQ